MDNVLKDYSRASEAATVGDYEGGLATLSLGDRAWDKDLAGEFQGVTGLAVAAF